MCYRPLMQIVVATFYHFFPCPDYAAQQPRVLALMQQHGLRGTLLLTPEGINSTVAGMRAGIDGFLADLKSTLTLSDFEHKESLCDRQPFKRAKVRLRAETISLGEPAPVTRVGTYVEPADWNALIDDPDTVVIDTRNDYEVRLGTFAGATDPQIHTFRQLPDVVRAQHAHWQGRKIATFCTGGIRCEKFTAWLLQNGFDQVYHLKGGILKYLEDVPVADSRWQGECFVFDDRIAVDHALQPSATASLCPQCSQTLTPEDYAHPLYVAGERCPHCENVAARDAALAAAHGGPAAHVRSL